MNVRFNYRYLVGLCLAAASFPALVFASGQEVRVGVSPTTSYSVKHDSVRVPSNAKVSPVKDISPIVNASARGGFEQTMRAGITIEANKTIPFSVKARVSAATMARGAKNFLKSGKANPYTFAGSLGLQALLDSVDWVIDEGGRVQKKTDSPIPDSIPDSYTSTLSMVTRTLIGDYTCDQANLGVPCLGRAGNVFYGCRVSYQGNGLTGYSLNSGLCYYGDVSTLPPPQLSPVTPLSIDEAVDDFYLPDITDFVPISQFVLPDSLSIDPIPNFYNDPITKTIYDGAGNPVQIQETNSYVEFIIDNSVTSNPSISTKTNTETKTYEDGVFVGSSTTSKDSASTEPDTSTGGGGGIYVRPNIEIPTDCAFFPTLCKWLDWTQEDAGDEPDLNKIINDADDFEREYKITGGAASCPAPYKLTIPFFAKTFDVSYQPFCDFATYLRYLFLAFCYFTAARYVVRSI